MRLSRFLLLAGAGFSAGAYVAVFLGAPTRAGLIMSYVGLSAVGAAVAIQTCVIAFYRLPPAYQRRLLCEWLHMHAGPIESHGPYSYIDCRRCEGLHTPMPRYYAEARFDDV